MTASEDIVEFTSHIGRRYEEICQMLGANELDTSLKDMLADTVTGNMVPEAQKQFARAIRKNPEEAVQKIDEAFRDKAYKTSVFMTIGSKTNYSSATRPVAAHIGDPVMTGMTVGPIPTPPGTPYFTSTQSPSGHIYPTGAMCFTPVPAAHTDVSATQVTASSHSPVSNSLTTSTITKVSNPTGTPIPQIVMQTRGPQSSSYWNRNAPTPTLTFTQRSAGNEEGSQKPFRGSAVGTGYPTDRTNEGVRSKNSTQPSGRPDPTTPTPKRWTLAQEKRWETFRKWNDWRCRQCSQQNRATWFTCSEAACDGQATSRQLPQDSWQCVVSCGQTNWIHDHYCYHCLRQNPHIPEDRLRQLPSY